MISQGGRSQRQAQRQQGMFSPAYNGVVGATPQRELRMAGFGDETSDNAAVYANAQAAVIDSMVNSANAARDLVNKAAADHNLSYDVGVQNFNQLVAAFGNSSQVIKANPNDDARRSAWLNVGVNLINLAGELEQLLGMNFAGHLDFPQNLAEFSEKVAQGAQNLLRGAGKVLSTGVWETLKPIMLIGGVALLLLFFAGKVGLSGSAGPVSFKPSNGYGGWRRHPGRRNKRRARGRHARGA